MPELEPIPQSMRYEELSDYTSDEQKHNLNLLSREEIDKLIKSRGDWYFEFADYLANLKEKGLTEEELGDKQLRSFLAGSSHPLEWWLSAEKDTENHDYANFINLLKSEEIDEELESVA